MAVYLQPGSPEQQHNDPALLKGATFFVLESPFDEMLEGLWLDERRRGRRGRSKSVGAAKLSAS
jgi:hypothetical protein